MRDPRVDPRPGDVLGLAALLTDEQAVAMAHCTGNYFDRTCRKKWSKPWRNYYHTHRPTQAWDDLVSLGLATATGSGASDDPRYYHVTALGLSALSVWYAARKADIALAGIRWSGVMVADLRELRRRAEDSA